MKAVDVVGLTQPEVSLAEWPLFASSVAEGALVAGAFVEVGVRHALSTCCVLQILNRLGERRLVVSIDPSPDARDAHAMMRNGSAGCCDAEFLLARSADVARTFDAAVAWLLIDGCHCYDCASADIRLWGPKVTPGGIVVLHDTKPFLKMPKANFCYATGKPENRMMAVARVVAESKELRASFDLVEAVESKTPYGIRVYRRRP